MKVSVVIPCYNAERHLDSCFRALMSQTLREIEFIFVDDGSTDGTPEILDSFALRDSRVRVFHQPNSGPGGARNTGMRASRGEYIGFFDADDLISERYYELLYDAAQANDADISMAHSLMYDRKNVLKDYYAVKAGVVAVEYADKFRYMDGVVWSKLFRRSFVEDNFDYLAFEEHVTRGEDTKFCIKALDRANKVVTVPEAVYTYMYVSDSVTHGHQTWMRQRHIYENRKWLRDFYLAHGLPLTKKRLAFCKWTIGIGGLNFIKAKDYGRFTIVRLFDLLPLWIIRNKDFKY